MPASSTSTASTSASPTTWRCATGARSPPTAIFIVVATISAEDGSVVADPEVIVRGVSLPEGEEALVEELKDVVEDSLEDAAEAGTRELHLIQEDIHEAIAKLVYGKLRSRPMILPVVVEV